MVASRRGISSFIISIVDAGETHIEVLENATHVDSRVCIELMGRQGDV